MQVWNLHAIQMFQRLNKVAETYGESPGTKCASQRNTSCQNCVVKYSKLFPLNALQGHPQDHVMSFHIFRFRFGLDEAKRLARPLMHDRSVPSKLKGRTGLATSHLESKLFAGDIKTT